MSIADEFSQSTSPKQSDLETSGSVERITSSQLTSSAEGSRVSHLVKPEHARARTILATSGRKCFELFLISGPSTSWQKTFLASCLCRTDEFSTRFTHHWKLRTTKHSRRLLFQLAPLGQDIAAIESGLLPTPRAAKRGARSHDTARAKLVKDGRTKHHRLEDALVCLEMKTGVPNPEYVEWLMGFPRMWTELQPSETPSSPKLQSGLGGE
jgi:hypothetical protein